MKKKVIQRNEIADGFFDCVSAFCRNTGASDFNSKAEYIHGKREKGLSSMVCTADYGTFLMEFSYFTRACAPGCAPSVLDIAVILEPQKPYYKYSLYDMMYLLAPDNFKCYRFSYIESPEKMKTCFESIKADLEDFLPKITAISKDYDALTNLRNKLTDAVKIYYGYNVFEQIDDESSGADFALQRYYSSYQLRFDSAYYAAFLRGDYEKALKQYNKARNKTLYEIRLCSFMETLVLNKTQYTATMPGCDTLNEGFKSVNTGVELLQFLLGMLVCYIPVSAVCLGLYYLFSYIIFHGAVYSESYLFGNAMCAFAVAVIPSIVCSFYLNKAGINLVPGKKRTKYKKYLKLNNRNSGCAWVVNIVAVIFAVVNMFNYTNTCTGYYESYFRYCDIYSGFQTVNVPYSDINCVIHSEGEYDSYGNWVEYEAYYIVLQNRDSFDISAISGTDTVKKKILPVLTAENIEIKEVRDAGEYTDAGTKR